jgi:hypothetical protein
MEFAQEEKMVNLKRKLDREKLTYLSEIKVNSKNERFRA